MNKNLKETENSAPETEELNSVDQKAKDADTETNQTVETPAGEGEFVEEVINVKLEWIKFIVVLGLLVVIGVGNIFVRQMPIIELRTYDYQTPFVFRNVWHDGEVRFKVCFHQRFMKFYGYYVCHRFPPTRDRYLKDGTYSTYEFTNLFIDPVYMGKFIAKFEQKNNKLGDKFLGFKIQNKPSDLLITPITSSSLKKRAQYKVKFGEEPKPHLKV